MEEHISVYRLREGLSFCRIDGRSIFLDVQQDRYFRLSDRLERAFTAWLDHADSGGIDDLVAHNVLTDVPRTANGRATQAIASPLHSAVELQTRPRSFGSVAFLDVFALVYSTQHWLKRRGLQAVIDGVLAYRDKQAPAPLSAAPNRDLLEAAFTFRAARLYVPVETNCLLDSLSLTRFLARRHLSAHLVFGVTDNPFAAHCWVQAGTWILNDTLGNATLHTPIRVV
jgi:hypothetical protein